MRAGTGAYHHRWQQAAGGPLTRDWTSMGGLFDSDPVVATNQDGRLEVFGRDADGVVRHDWQVAANGSWA